MEKQYINSSATLKPSNTSETGYSIVEAVHVGGHRSVEAIDDLAGLCDWQLGTASTAEGQVWYVHEDSSFYQLRDWSKRNAPIAAGGWVKLEYPTQVDISVSQTLTSGTEIGAISVGDTTTKLYAPEPTIQEGTLVLKQSLEAATTTKQEVSITKDSGNGIIEADYEKDIQTIMGRTYILDVTIPTSGNSDNLVVSISSDGDEFSGQVKYGETKSFTYIESEPTKDIIIKIEISEGNVNDDDVLEGIVQYNLVEKYTEIIAAGVSNFIAGTKGQMHLITNNFEFNGKLYPAGSCMLCTESFNSKLSEDKLKDHWTVLSAAAFMTFS